MDIETAIELISTIGLKNKLGRYNSRCLNKEWFEKNNQIELWNTIHHHTECIDKRSLGERLWAFEHLPIPLCECGNPVKRYDNENKWSSYCSLECSLHSTKRASKISNSKLSLDSSVSNSKRKATMLAKYGVETNSQRLEVKKIISESRSKQQLTEFAYKMLNDIDWLNEQYNINKRSALDIGNEIGCDYSTVLCRIRSQGWEIRQVYNTSVAQKEITRFVESLGFTTSSPTNLLSGKQEIDVYIEEKSVGIELNGLRWHSYPSFETTEQKQKHLNKTVSAEQNNIQLLHFTDYQWVNQQEIVKSIIRSKLNLCERIYARKCTIAEISSKQAIEFLDNNHIQGSVGCKYRYGLTHNGELVAIATFGVPRYDKTFDWELLRFCTKLNTTVVGGLSKLIKHFMYNHNGSIISYADRMRSNGNAYSKTGFTLIRSTKPGYFWTNGNIVLSRTKCSKNKLAKLLTNFDEQKSEAENMFGNGYRRFWDCGQLVYSLK